MKLYEILVTGEDAFVHGLLQGFALGREKNEKVYWCSDYDIITMHHTQSIASKLGLGKKYSNFVVEASMLQAVTDALESFEEDLDFSVEKVNEVTGLEFDMEIEIFSEKHGKLAQQVIANRDPDITLQDFSGEEMYRKDAEGAELYAPEHEYIYKGEGQVKGPFSTVLSFYYRLKDIPQVKLSKMRIRIAE